MTAIMDAAQNLAALGWRVHPLHYMVNGRCSCGTDCGKSKAKHPRLDKWTEAATTDDIKILEWWSNGHAKCNVGIVTGRESGLVVIDIDPRNGGDEGLSRLEQEYGVLPDTIMVRTPSGGRHFYLAYPPGDVHIGNRAALGGRRGVDVRGEGGQVVAPPSVGANGTAYKWASEAGSPAAIPPAWLALLTTPKPSATPTMATDAAFSKVRAADALAAMLKIRPKADENDGSRRLLTVACRAVEFDIIEADALKLIRQYETVCPFPRSYTDTEILQRLKDAANKTTGRVGCPDDDFDLTGIRPLDTDNGEPSHAGDESANSGELAAVMRDKCGRTLTDTGNAERFARQHKGRAIYCGGRWYVWDGRRWAQDTGKAVERLAVRTARNIYVEASKCDDAEMRENLALHARRSEAKSKLDAMVGLGASFMSVRPEALDSDPWKLNVKNGIIDLKTGTLSPHDPKALITKMANVAFDPQAEAPVFVQFINTTFRGDTDLIRSVQRQSGMCLTGDIGEQYLWVYYGTGANGKSTYCDLSMFIMGDYAGPAAPGLLTVKRNEQHPTELADLQGRRLVIASETETGQTLRLQLVKQITGDESIKARHMRQDFYSFRRTHKLVLMTNNRPRVPENSVAAWRRIRLVPFAYVVPEADRNPHLLDELKAEAPGVLNWLIAGCLDWQREGLGVPEAVKTATDEYRCEQDSVGEFADERCIIDPMATVTRSAIFKAYSDWCAASGERKPDRNALFEYLRKVEGVTEEKPRVGGKTTRQFCGIRVANEVPQ